MKTRHQASESSDCIDLIISTLFCSQIIYSIKVHKVKRTALHIQWALLFEWNRTREKSSFYFNQWFLFIQFPPTSQHTSLFSCVSALSPSYHSFLPLPTGSAGPDGRAGRVMRAPQYLPALAPQTWLHHRGSLSKMANYTHTHTHTHTQRCVFVHVNPLVLDLRLGYRYKAPSFISNA